eukprot:7376069-Prymnesium_polylepis.2
MRALSSPQRVRCQARHARWGRRRVRCRGGCRVMQRCAHLVEEGGQREAGEARVRPRRLEPARRVAHLDDCGVLGEALLGGPQAHAQVRFRRPAADPLRPDARVRGGGERRREAPVGRA